MTKVRASLTVILILLAFGTSLLTVDQLSYRTTILGYDAQDSLFSKIVSGKSSGAMGIEPPGYLKSNQVQDPILIQLSVAVTQDLLGRIRPVFRAMVNVSQAVVESDSSPVEPEERSVYVPGGNGTALVTLVSGVTDVRGIVAFRVPPGNYTILVADFGIVGSKAITLVTSIPRVFLRWAFHDRLESPAFIQINAQNADGIILPGETIVFFYTGGTNVEPYQTRIVLKGYVDATVDLQILEFNAFEHGSYIVATPLRPIRISDLTVDSSIAIEATWYEVSITS
jgi:hypothetical protein